MTTPTDPDDAIKRILDSMPKFTVEPPKTLEVDKEALQAKYDFIVDYMNSRPLTKDEKKWKAAVEHYMTCDDPAHNHDIVYTYWDEESRG